MDMESRNGASTSRVVKKKKEWTPMFPVPSYFVESYGGAMPSKVTFRTDESEKKWKVKVEKFKDQYFFTEGWEEFEKDVDLKSRELILYRTAFSSKRKGKKKEKRRKVIDDAHGTMKSLNKYEGFGVEKNSSFNIEMKKYHQYRLDLPIFFAESSGILVPDQIKLRNSEGREWPVHVTNRHKVFSLGGGWFDFLKGNNIVVGSTLSFVSSSSDTIDVQIIKEGANKEALFEYMRYRGSERGPL